MRHTVQIVMPFQAAASGGRNEFERWRAALQPLLDHRYAREVKLASRERVFRLDGVCAICGARTAFRVSTEGGEKFADGRVLPNWRETMVCACNLNNRERGLAHALLSQNLLDASASVEAISPVTNLTAWLKQRSPRLALGSPGRSRLTAADGSLDLVISIESLEREDDRVFAREAARALRPGGWFAFTSPFHYGQDATIRDNGVNRLGWDVLDDLRDAGFPTPEAWTYWSEELGYLGPFNFLFMAQRG